MKRFVTLLLAALIAAATSGAAMQQQTANAGVSPATRQKLMESLARGAAFLHKQQRPDGKYDNHPGVTAMVAIALLKQPGAREKELAAVGRSLDFLKSL